VTLVLLMAIPLAGALVLAISPERQAKWIALAWTTLALGVGVFASFEFQWAGEAAKDFQFPAAWAWIESLGVTLSVGADSVSMLLILLTLLLGPISVTASFNAITTRRRLYYASLLVLQAAMTGVFASRDIVLFYLCFEFTLAPMFVLIREWGSTNRRAASIKFFLYTFTGSILTLAGLAYVAWFHTTLAPTDAMPHLGQWSFSIEHLLTAAQRMGPAQQMWVLLAMLAGFAVKVPVFPVHTWLPLAHTEAPTAGSVILAGVLLKLGTYGLYRFAIPFAPQAIVALAPALAVLAIIGIIYAGLVCWAQRDVKKLVAYSSVSHLGFCVLGLVALNMAGASGSVLYMINHGLSTGALFLCIGMIYERYHTRSMDELGGLAARMPVWAFFMVFFTLASVGLPGLNGFVSEFLTMLGAFQASEAWGPLPGATPGALGPIYGALAATGVIIAAIYLLYMVGRIVFGPLKEPDDHGHHDGDAKRLPPDLNLREILILSPLAVLCLALGFYPAPVLHTLEAPTRQTLMMAQGYLPGAADPVIPEEFRAVPQVSQHTPDGAPPAPAQEDPEHDATAQEAGQ